MHETLLVHTIFIFIPAEKVRCLSTVSVMRPLRELPSQLLNKIANLSLLKFLIATHIFSNGEILPIYHY